MHLNFEEQIMRKLQRILLEELFLYAKDRLLSYVGEGLSNKFLPQKRNHELEVFTIINRINRGEIKSVIHILSELESIPLENVNGSLARRIREIHEEIYITLSSQSSEGYNPLMYAAYSDNESLEPLFQLLRTLQHPEQIRNILMQTDKGSGENALMIAMEMNDHHQKAREMLVSLSVLKHPADKEKVLTQVNKFGYNVLMKATRDYPGITAELINEIKEVGNSSLTKKMLGQAEKNGLTAIMFALRNRTTTMSSINLLFDLLDSIESRDDKLSLLMQTNKTDKNNLLMFAALYRPEAIERILQSIKSLNNFITRLILSEKNTDVFTAMELVEQKFPSESSPLELLCNTLLPAEFTLTSLKQEILMSGGITPLMLATRFQLTNPLSKILDTISQSGNEKDNLRFFRRASQTGGYSTLHYAVMFPGKSLALILEAISKFSDPLDKVAILSQQTALGRNVLMLAACFNPDTLMDLLSIINTFEIEEQTTIFLQTDPDGRNSLEVAMHKQCKAAATKIRSMMENLNLSTPSPTLVIQRGETREDIEDGRFELTTHRASSASSPTFFYHPSSSQAACSSSQDQGNTLSSRDDSNYSPRGH